MKKLFAFLFPGVLQLWRVKPRVRDGVLFLLGIGSFIGIIWLVVSWPVHHAPLENFFWLNIPDLAEIYPLHVSPAVQAAGTIQPILPDNTHLLVRIPMFWPTLAGYGGVYLLCSALSFWEYGHAGSGHAGYGRSGKKSGHVRS